MKISTYTLLFLTCLIFSCKTTVDPDLIKVEEQEKLYKANPSKETSAGYIAAVTLYNSQHLKTETSKKLLIAAQKVATEQGQIVVSAGIINELIKQYPEDSKTKSRITELVTAMENAGKKEASQALQFFYSKKYPTEETSKNYVSNLGEQPNTTEEYIKMKAERIFMDPSDMGLNKNNSFEYVDAAEAFVMVNPTDTIAPSLLFNSAEIAKTLGTFKKSLSLYDWVINNYPNSKYAPTSQFLKAFILEDNLKNLDAARENYEKFIANYPDHHFADDAAFSLKNLGKSNQEIQEELEMLQQQNASKAGEEQ